MQKTERTGTSPVRAALSGLNKNVQQAEDSRVREKSERLMATPEDVPGKLLFWRILLAPYVPTYDGLIETPEITKRAEEIRSCMGRVVAIGHFAFKSKTTAGLDLSEEPNIPKVGDYVLHETYAGQEIELRGNKKLRCIVETDILMIIDDPEKIRGYL